MSRLILIRHGQASFGADDYDVLSPLGIAQARALGAFLADRGLLVDAIVTGTLRRQRDTAAHAAEAATTGSVRWPEPNVDPAFDEYPAIELIRRCLPALRERDAEVRAAMDRMGQSPSSADMLKVYGTLSRLWARGELDIGELETFAAFDRRVRAGLADVQARYGPRTTVAVVTSGGPIALAMRCALDLSPDKTLDCAWVIANSSMSEFRCRDGEINLVGFNHVPHLRKELLTYR